MSNDLKVGDVCEVINPGLAVFNTPTWIGREVTIIAPEEHYEFERGEFLVVEIDGFKVQDCDGSTAIFSRECLRKRPPGSRDQFLPAIEDDWSAIGWSPNKAKEPV